MNDPRIDRYERLAGLTARVARAAAELEGVRAGLSQLPERAATELEELADRLQAVHLLLANEVERAWNAAEAQARRERRGVLMGRLHEAVSGDALIDPAERPASWPTHEPDRPI